MNVEVGTMIIKEIAKENDYNISGEGFSFEIYKSTLRPKSFKVRKKDSDLLVYQWEDENGEYGTNAIYSLRSLNDVIKFATLLSIGTEIRSGRNR